MKIGRRVLIALFILMAMTVAYSNHKVIGYEKFSVREVGDLPVEKTCLVLGTSKFLSGGGVNQFYAARMEAAKLAYSAGKCSKFVVSGDNRKNDYNEPEQMKQSLLELGVPAENIYCDYAGGRTLDSVLRFKHIFGQSSGIVISQEFHNARAIYIGRASGINLVGFSAKDADAYNGFRTKVREIFSRMRAVADVELFHSEPRHYGDAIKI